MLAQRELSIDLTRHFMALFANANRGKSDPPFTAQDFLWRLSYDTLPDASRPIEEVTAESVKRFKETKALLGSKINKENGGQ